MTSKIRPRVLIETTLTNMRSQDREHIKTDVQTLLRVLDLGGGAVMIKDIDTIEVRCVEGKQHDE